jgi:hypothetical protein
MAVAVDGGGELADGRALGIGGGGLYFRPEGVDHLALIE